MKRAPEDVLLRSFIPPKRINALEECQESVCTPPWTGILFADLRGHRVTSWRLG